MKMKYLTAEAEALIDKIRKYDPILANFYSEKLERKLSFQRSSDFFTNLQGNLANKVISYDLLSLIDEMNGNKVGEVYNTILKNFYKFIFYSYSISVGIALITVYLGYGALNRFKTEREMKERLRKLKRENTI
jgi:hypothetical protein